MKTNLLLLHGALGSKKQFEDLKQLLKEDFDIHLLNFEGHGGRDTEDEFSIQLFTKNVISYLDQAQIETIHVFGYSMGGYVALNTAIYHPKRISKILTLATKFNWDKESTAQEIRMLNPEKIKEKVPHFAQKLAEEHAPMDWEVMMQKTAAMMKGLSEGKGLEVEALKKLKQEVKISVGDQDKMVSIEESQQLANLIPQASCQVIEGFPHPIAKIPGEELAAFIKQSLG